MSEHKYHKIILAPNNTKIDMEEATTNKERTMCRKLYNKNSDSFIFTSQLPSLLVHEI